jgi:hypothetical protein
MQVARRLAFSATAGGKFAETRIIGIFASLDREITLSQPPQDHRRQSRSSSGKWGITVVC